MRRIGRALPRAVPICARRMDALDIAGDVGYLFGVLPVVIVVDGPPNDNYGTTTRGYDGYTKRARWNGPTHGRIYILSREGYVHTWSKDVAWRIVWESFAWTLITFPPLCVRKKGSLDPVD